MQLKYLFIVGLAVQAAAHAGPAISGFDPDRQARFACRISARVSKHLAARGQTFAQLSREIKANQRNDVGRWSDALVFDQPILGKSQVLYKSYDYFLQNAFINVGHPVVNERDGDNWFGAYAFMSAKTETQFRLGEIPKYNLSINPRLLKDVAAYLPDVRDLRWPRFLNDEGRPKSAAFNCRRDWWYGEICSAADAEPLGDNDHPAYAEWIRQAQRANLIASPLFTWLVAQPLNSVSYEALFDRASDVYQDPIVAIGVISWMFMVDAQMGHRGRGAVTSSRIEPMIYGSDRPGDNYHFWGYAMKAMVGDRFKYEIMAFVNEVVVQGDRDDWQVDRLAFAFGSAVARRIKNPSLCGA